MVAAESDNEEGVGGIDWECSIVNEVIFNMDDAAAAIRSGVARGACIINCPFNSPVDNAVTRAAVLDAVLCGATVVSEMGEDWAEGQVRYPAGWSGLVTAVGGYKCDGVRYGNWGPHVDVAGPAYAVWSTFPGGAYGWAHDCGIASDHVAAIEGLMRAAKPHLTDADFEEVLERTARPAGGPVPNQYYGWGQVRAAAALHYITERHIVHRVVLGTQLTPELHASGNWVIDYPPDGAEGGWYWIRVWRMSAHVDYDYSYEECPDVWVRAAGTEGFCDPDDYTYPWPWGGVGSHDITGADLETYVYEVWNHYPRYFLYWWPCALSEARIAYTIAGVLTAASGCGEGAWAGEFKVEERSAGNGVEFDVSMPEAGVIEANIFDINGRVVWTSGRIQAERGVTQVTWNRQGPEGRAVEAGLYFVRVKSDNYGTVKRKCAIF